MAIDPAPEDLKAFAGADTGRPMVMVQLLRFAEGGRDKYLEYTAAMQPVLLSLGARVLYGGECGEPLLAAQKWDAVVVVRYPNHAAYLSMLADPVHAQLEPLRRSALQEVMLLPANDWAGR